MKIVCNGQSQDNISIFIKTLKNLEYYENKNNFIVEISNSLSGLNIRL